MKDSFFNYPLSIFRYPLEIKMNLSKKAILVFEDGRTFRGAAFGAEGEVFRRDGF